MIRRPNSNGMSMGVGAGDFGAKQKAQTSFTSPTDNNAARISSGSSNHGFGFSNGPDGMNNTPRPTSDVPKIPGA